MYENHLGMDYRKAAAVATISALLISVFAATVTPSAFAAKPNNQACLGEDVSGYAQGGADFGGFISSIAESTPGVGSDIQAHLAGQVPDSVIPNSCND